MNILSLYCTLYSTILKHFRNIKKRNPIKFMKSFNPNCSLANKTCYSRYCNSISASSCNYCFVTFSMCIIRNNSMHKLLYSTRTASVSNILGECRGRNMYSEFRISASGHYFSKLKFFRPLHFSVLCALSDFFFSLIRYVFRRLSKNIQGLFLLA